MIKHILILLSFFSSVVTYAQCGTDEYNKELSEQHMKAGETYEEYLNQFRNFEYEVGTDLKTKKAILTIPVVFHVLHTYGDDNISKAQIEDQIRIINEDFQRLNADASNTRSAFLGRAANFELEFKLARVAPDGSCTEGITRKYDPVNTIEDRQDKNQESKSSVPPWDPSKYLNIWVVTEIQSSSTEGTILGYAQFPWTNSPSTDGIVIRNDRVGTIGTAVASDKGRTLTHEIGHWVGLLHTFQGGGNQNGCNAGDGIADTPPVAEASFGCQTTKNSCNNDSPDEVDMVENYMDYSNGSCMNAFTKGQKTRALAFFANGQKRASNISASTLATTGVNTSPTCKPIADFWYNSDDLKICAGGEIEFQDFSYNGPITSRTWTFAGGTPATSSAANPTIVFNSPGVYNVELEVGNSEGTSNLTRQLMVTVLPLIAGQTAPYTEDFASSSSTNEWQLEKTLNGDGWARNTQRGFSGNQCLEASIDDETPPSTRYTAEMLPVDMTTYEGSSPLLFFKYAYARRATSGSEILFVRASTNCGDSWKNIGIYNSTKLVTGPVQPGWQPSSISDWGSKEVDLSDYADENNLYLSFQVISQSGNSVFIDDISIGNAALTVPSYSSDFDISLIPNPAQNSVRIKRQNNGKPTQISIVDITGRLLLHQTLDPSEESITTTDLTNGVYTVVIDSEDKRWSKKLIISK